MLEGSTMSHHPKPFFRTGRGWFLQLGKQQMKLADGPDTVESKDAAWQRYHELMAERAKATPQAAKPDAITVVEVLDKYLAWCRAHRAERTYEWYHDHIQGFINHAGEVVRQPATDLKPFHVVEWADSHADNWSNAYRRGAIVAIQRPFNFAEQLGYIAHSPIRRIPKPEAQRREQAVSPEEWQQIKNHYPDGDPFRDMLEFGWETGCRPQEVKRIEPRHVELAQHRVVFPAEESKGKKYCRVIYLTPRAEEILKRQLSQHDEGITFRNKDDHPWTAQAVACRFGRLEKHIGVKYAAYSIRHGFATRKLTEGHDHLTVAEIMGHRDGRMLAQTYQHLNQRGEHLRRVLESRQDDSQFQSR
jgi:integrase/recombinase XerC